MMERGSAYLITLDLESKDELAAVVYSSHENVRHNRANGNQKVKFSSNREVDSPAVLFSQQA